MTSDAGTVLYTKQDAVALIVLNRPEVINAFNMQMRDDLYATLEAAVDDPDVRAIVVSGSGDRGFCVGADLTEFGTAPSQVVARDVRWERDLWGLFLAVRKPLVAALHGHVIGSGVEIACLCDIRIAADDAVFRMPETALGMVPAAGGTQTLPRVVGRGRALEVLLASSPVEADRALEIGLVHRVVSRGSLKAEAQSQAAKLSRLDPGAVAALKQAVIDGSDLPYEDGLALERRLAGGILVNR
jgi:enoyl-CoA hydratase/carnithine racemase